MSQEWAFVDLFLRKGLFYMLTSKKLCPKIQTTVFRGISIANMSVNKNMRQCGVANEIQNSSLPGIWKK